MSESRTLQRSCLVAILSAVILGLGGPAAADPVVCPLVEEPATEQPAAGQPAGETPAVEEQEFHARGAGRANVLADFSPRMSTPVIAHSAYLDPLSSVIGAVAVGRRVYVAPFASVRGDEGQPIHVGNDSNVQDAAVVHGLETFSHGKPVPGNTYVVGGKPYGVYIGDRVSLAHQAQVHGPAWIENDVFVGMQVLVFRAKVGAGSVLEPGSQVFGRLERIEIPPNRYVKAGTMVHDQAAANALPCVTADYPFRLLNRGVVEVNTALADGYNGKGY